jgi:hypothetical protein
MPIGTRKSCLMKKTGREKSCDNVSLSSLSSCSKGYGYCLTNRPQKNFLEKEVKKISKFAGEFFDENAQCELVFGQAGHSSRPTDLSRLAPAAVQYIFLIV